MLPTTLTAILAVAAAPLASAQLNKLAQDAGKMYFGTATDNGELNNTQYVSILSNKSEFGQLTPSNGMKWFAVEPELGIYNYSYGSVVADLAAKNKQILRCHTLVWHSQLAPWVEATNWTKATLTKALVDHVTAEAKHWAGKCYAWDVLNEALNEDGTYRNTTFLQVLGPSYIAIAFRAAAAADPHAKLYYNDYNIERIGNKSNGVREGIVGYLKKQGIRIDGVGMQAHFTAGKAPGKEEQVSNMKLYADMGVELAITELDIRVDLPVNTTNLAQQSTDYENTISACMQVDECIGMTVWDFYDPFSWVPDVFPGQGAATLYFQNFTKHPAYDGIVRALKGGKKPDSGDNEDDEDCDDEEDDDDEHGHGKGGKGKKGHH